MTSPSTSPAGSATTSRAEIGVIGGSGLYDFLDDYESVEIDTPSRRPSDPLVVGEVEGRRVAFVARHGKGHRLLHTGSTTAPTSGRCGPSGSARSCRRARSARPGRQRARHDRRARPGSRPHVGPPHAFYEDEGPVVHVGFADPFCPNGRQVAVDAARLSALDVVPDSALVVVNGPRFSSRAESVMHQQAGWSIVGMTTMPEATLARELAMCFDVAMVTDLDAGVEGGDAVSHEEVLRVFAANVERLKSVLRDAVGRMPAHDDDDEATCPCRRSLDGIKRPSPSPDARPGPHGRPGRHSTGAARSAGARPARAARPAPRSVVGASGPADPDRASGTGRDASTGSGRPRRPDAAGGARRGRGGRRRLARRARVRRWVAAALAGVAAFVTVSALSPTRAAPAGCRRSWRHAPCLEARRSRRRISPSSSALPVTGPRRHCRPSRRSSGARPQRRSRPATCSP